MGLLEKDLISNIYCFNSVTGPNFGFTHLLCSKIDLLAQVFGEGTYSVLLQAPIKQGIWVAYAQKNQIPQMAFRETFLKVAFGGEGCRMHDFLRIAWW